MTSFWGFFHMFWDGDTIVCEKKKKKYIYIYIRVRTSTVKT